MYNKHIVLKKYIIYIEEITYLFILEKQYLKKTENTNIKINLGKM